MFFLSVLTVVIHLGNSVCVCVGFSCSLLSLCHSCQKNYIWFSFNLSRFPHRSNYVAAKHWFCLNTSECSVAKFHKVPPKRSYSTKYYTCPFSSAWSVYIEAFYSLKVEKSVVFLTVWQKTLHHLASESCDFSVAPKLLGPGVSGSVALELLLMGWFFCLLVTNF